MKFLYEPAGLAREYAALAINLYTGCTSGCTYCYAPSILHRPPSQFHAAANPRPNILSHLESDLLTLHSGAPSLKHLRSTPVLLCFVCDPYPADSQATTAALRMLSSYRHPVTILTKNPSRCLERDFNLIYDNPSWTLAITLTSISPDATTREPGAEPPFSRIAALKSAYSAGIKTWASFEPIFSRDECLESLTAALPYLHGAAFGLLNHHGQPAVDPLPLMRDISRACTFTPSFKSSFFKGDTHAPR